MTAHSLETSGGKVSEELSFPSEKWGYVEIKILMRMKLSQAEIFFFLIVFRQAHLERHSSIFTFHFPTLLLCYNW